MPENNNNAPKIVTSNSIKLLRNRGNKKYASVKTGYMMYVEGYGWCGPYNTKSAAKEKFEAYSDSWDSFEDNFWWDEITEQQFYVSTVGELREFVRQIEHISDDTPIEQPQKSWWEGFIVRSDGSVWIDL